MTGDTIKISKRLLDEIRISLEKGIGSIDKTLGDE